MQKFVSVLLLAGGQGSRFGGTVPKQFLVLGDKRVIFHSLDLFLSHSNIQEIIIVCDEPYRDFFSSYESPRIRFAMPGDTRQQSVQHGLAQVAKQSELVCVHDSARPFLTSENLEKLLEEASLHQAAVLAMPAKNTIKEVKEGFIQKTLDRSLLWEMQTPQVIATDLFQKAMTLAVQQKLNATDDVALVELLGVAAKIVPSSYQNIKITTQDDMLVATAFLTGKYAEV